MRVSQYRYWLDLSFYSHQALQALEHLQAAQALEQQLVQFVERLPGIEAMCFSDGRPFASPETRQWLEQASATHAGDASAGLSELDTLLQKSKIAAKGDKPEQGFSMLQEALEGASVAEQVELRCQLATLMSEAGHPKLALSQIESVLEAVEHYRLEEWDPQLALYLLGSAYDLFHASGDGRRAQQTLARIALLSPVEAMQRASN